MKNYYFILIITLSHIIAFAQDPLCSIGDLTSGGATSGGSTQTVFSISEHNDNIFSGTNRLLRKHLGNNQWEVIANTALTDNISALISFNGDLYVGTQFGGFRLDETSNTLIPIGNGLNGAVSVFMVYNGQLVAGGQFTRENGSSASLNGIATWNGTSWESFGDGFNTVPPGFTLEVYDVAIYEGDLIASGKFRFSGSTTVDGLARWDGAAWQPFGTGLFWAQHAENYGIGSALSVQGGNLYVAGYFDSVNNVAASNLARFDGSQWTAMGATSNDAIFDMKTLNDILYISGRDARNIGGTNYDIAAFNGTTWSGVANTEDSVFWVSVLETNANESILYAGGNFSSMNTGNPDVFINTGTICEIENCTVLGVEEQNFSQAISLYPNPFLEEINIGLNDVSDSSIEIYNILGQKNTDFDFYKNSETKTITVNLRNINSGIYLVKIKTNHGEVWKKIVKK